MSENFIHLHHIVNVRPLGGYRLWCKFEDGFDGVVDLSDLAETNIYGKWKTEPGYFESVAIDPLRLSGVGRIRGQSGIVTTHPLPDLIPERA